jgi:hypothetical protein
MTTYWNENTSQDVVREGEVAKVIQGHGYYNPGKAAVELTDTGNGFIARFPSRNCMTQDYYVCLDYAQAYDLVLALSAFKTDLGFA